MTTLHCSINLPEAIRRGFNASKNMDVEIDVRDLTKEDRDLLSEYIMGGNFKHPVVHYWPRLPEPTQKGLCEALAEIRATASRVFRLDDVTHGALDGALADKADVAVGNFLVTENGPNAAWPPCNYCAWRIVSTEGGIVQTQLDIEASRKFCGQVRTAPAKAAVRANSNLPRYVP